MSNFSDKVAFIWSVADLLRGPYKPHQYGRVILPLTVLRRLDVEKARRSVEFLAKLYPYSEDGHNSIAAFAESVGQYDVWSQNLGHEQVLTTFVNYGEVSSQPPGSDHAGRTSASSTRSSRGES